MRRIVFLLIAAALCAAFMPAGSSAERPLGDTRLFARIGDPGSPEGIIVHNGVVYVGTHVSVRGNGGGPASKIFKLDLATGAPLGEITIQGQDTSITHGILAMAFDPTGNLYVVDRNPGRIIRIDAVSGAQATYATIPDLKPCAVDNTSPCAPGVFAQEPTFADYLAFAPDGSMYVTDLQASTIFRIPPGGGASQIWYQDAGFDSIFGLNGIAVDPTRAKLVFAMTGSVQPGTPAQGIIYTLPLQETSPQPSDLKVLHVFNQPAAGPDGIAFGASGRLYVALAGANQVAILNPDGSEFAIFPDTASNQAQEIPYDLPASIAEGEGLEPLRRPSPALSGFHMRRA